MLYEYLLSPQNFTHVLMLDADAALVKHSVDILGASPGFDPYSRFEPSHHCHVCAFWNDHSDSKFKSHKIYTNDSTALNDV